MKTNIISILFLSLSLTALAQNVCNNSTHSGEGTYYDFEAAGGFGNCSYDDTQISPFLIGAMNDTDYGNADYCGACIHIDGPQGSVKVQIIDRCPECKPGDVDLSPEAFQQLAPLVDGRIDIDWYVVPCQVNGNIKFHYKEGSNKWWLGIQVRNTVTHVAKLEIFQNGAYVELSRERYNYFIAESAPGFVGPLQFRITDVYGSVIEENAIAFSEALIDTEVNGTQQFPSCNIVGVDDKQATGVIIQDGTIRIKGTGEYQLYDNVGRMLQSGNYENEISVDQHSSNFMILHTVNGIGEKSIYKIIQ